MPYQSAEEAKELGIDRGWTHANYVEAYGPDDPVKPGEEGAPGRMMPGWIKSATGGEGHAVRKAYRDGFNLGKRRHAAGKWQDGTKREDD